ncbi:polyprenyl synthetase family protein [Dermacoccus sp. PAMC28757]|uniref:polyprenyl synthetase family protein n=1 Tax=Dermacoccus sp. PAMC28757 TaxID=2762331 RepID=UPI002103AAC9|nr:polyprenyl synthetase family protein [Dermacoccus sp. PAMC28757]
MPNSADASQLLERIQRTVDAEVAHQREVLAPLGDETDLMVDAIASLLSGGKRVRASFLYWGYRAAGGADSDALVRASASMELFQAAALLHDDVMDASDTRRGMPAAHRAMASAHRERGLTGDADRFGEAGAILAGDLCLTWADEMYATSGLPADEVLRGRRVFDLMRTQLMGGQFLDVLEAVQNWEGLATDERITRALRVIRYKSAKYTMEHPLLIGATCAGGDDATLEALSRYGLALGEAYQLRDDLLGVFGDPAQTGKPAGDDLREGKRTVIVAHLLDDLCADDRAFFDTRFGHDDLDTDEIERFRALAVSTGAVDAVEQRITQGADEARTALESLRESMPTEAFAALHDFIGTTTARSS